MRYRLYDELGPRLPIQSMAEPFLDRTPQLRLRRPLRSPQSSHCRYLNSELAHKPPQRGMP
jgi:hypothetical protein